jgi:hypothetical protein
MACHFAFSEFARSVPIDETADQPGKRLMFGTRFASSEKISEFDLRHGSAAGHVGFVQDEDAAVVVATEQPFVAILAAVNLALVIGHLASAGTTNGDPDSFRAVSNPCHLPALRIRFGR